MLLVLLMMWDTAELIWVNAIPLRLVVRWRGGDEKTGIVWLLASKGGGSALQMVRMIGG